MIFKSFPLIYFLSSGDHILIRCTHSYENNCHFLIYYTYKNFPYKYVDEDDYICEDDNYPELFKFVYLI